MNNKSKKIFVCGHNGMVGSAILRQLDKKENIEIFTKTREQLNLEDQNQVKRFFNGNSFDEVYLCAAKVGGIIANNDYPYDFIFKNLEIQNNVINACIFNGITKLLFLGSSCIYPRDCSQPIQEEDLLTGLLEKTNEPYAIAKIAGIKLCESANRQFGLDYRCVMPTNLYGPGDNFNLENSHVIPALLRKFHEAKIKSQKYVEIWGSGKPFREFLHVEDMANASIHVMDLDKKEIDEKNYSHINIGTGNDISIYDLSNLISKIVGFKGELKFDSSRPDGTPRKCLNIDKITSLGWIPKIPLESGLRDTYKWYKNHHQELRMA